MVSQKCERNTAMVDATVAFSPADSHLEFSELVQRSADRKGHGVLIRWCLRRQHHQEAAMAQYSHPGLSEREDVMVLRHLGMSVGEVARRIGRSKSTVSRELARNSCERSYRASAAQRLSECCSTGLVHGAEGHRRARGRCARDGHRQKEARRRPHTS